MFARFVQSIRSFDAFARLVHLTRSFNRSLDPASLKYFLLVLEVIEDVLFIAEFARWFFRLLEKIKEVLACLGRILARKKFLGREFHICVVD